MVQKIIEIIAEYQDKPISSYRPDQKFTEMGLDSLDMAELMVILEEEGYSAELSADLNTPEKLAAARSGN